MKSLMAVALLVLSSHSLAKPLNVDALQACALVENDFKRLMCYDNVMVDKALPAKAKHTVEPAKANEIATQQAVTPEFGLENKVKPVQDKLEAKITSLYSPKIGKQTYTLDNKQVWKQTDSTPLRVKEGDTVVISRAAFGSFLMNKKGSKRSTRVKRTK